ncbi:MAG: GTP-binding protein [Anaerolineae bacterium]|nr:GTP-binding protein [Anaerolineae bacterium]
MEQPTGRTIRTTACPLETMRMTHRAKSSLPTRLADIRRLLEALEWEKLLLQVEQEAHARLAIVGPVNSGKSTLFNLLKGRKVSPVKAVPGTTKELITEEMGPFVLVDTPGFGEVGGVDRAAIARAAAEAADVIVLVLDGAAGLRQADYDLYESLRTAHVPLVVALNKIDLIKRDLAEVQEDVERKLGTPVIPISARTGAGVGERLIPAIVAAHPPIAIALGRALPRYRRQIGHRVARGAAALSALIAAEPLPGMDIPLLLATQVRMVLRIAAIYGESLSVSHAREMLTTVAGGVALRYLAAQAGKLVPGPGWLVGAVVTGLGTMAIGEVAIAYFESGKRLTPRQLRQLYRLALRRPRRRPVDGQAITEAQGGTEAPGG